MHRRPVVVASLVIVAVMALAAAWAWLQLPDGARVPIHWGADGRPDDWADKAIALFALPATALGIIGLFLVIPLIEPRRANLERSATAYHSIWLATLVLLGLIQVGVVVFALGGDLDMTALALGGTGAMFVVIGNVMGKLRSTFLVGVRTPWTLTSERSWDLTHRLAGRLFVALGLGTIALTLVGLDAIALLSIVGGAALAVVAAVVIYSYRVWRTDPDRRTI
jgi:uncharacterized membrane protein